MRPNERTKKNNIQNVKLLTDTHSLPNLKSHIKSLEADDADAALGSKTSTSTTTTTRNQGIREMEIALDPFVDLSVCVSLVGWLLLLAISPFLLTHLIAEHPSTHAASFSLFWTPKQTHSHTRECGKKSTHQQGGLLRSFLRDGDVFLFFMKHLCIYIYFA